MKYLIKFIAKRTHNIQVQLLCSTIYGALCLYGFGGTMAIIMKARKMTKKSKVQRND